LTPQVSKPRILLVEDNPADVGLIQLALKDANLECDLTVLEDGAEALALFRRRDSSETAPVPDLAILDLNLPKIGGLEVLEAIRGNPVLDGMPVAILSSSSSPRERLRVEECGVDRFLTKPLDLDGFLRLGSVLKALIETGRAGQSRSG
jgi:CheY-like chemotaxis protein